MRRASSWIVAAVLASAACSGAKRSASDGREREPDVKLERFPAVTIHLQGEAVYGRPVDVVVRVRNATDAPVILSELVLTSGAGEIVVARPVVPVTAKLDGDGAVVDGTVFVEEIRAQARSPAPPRWEWQGDGKVYSVHVLAAGATFEARGSFRPGEATGPELEAAATYFALPASGRLLEAMEHDLERLSGAPPAGSSDWAPAAKVRVVYRPVSGTPASSRPLEWPGGPAPALADVPPFGTHALAAAHFEVLSPSRAQGELALAVKGPSVTLADARARAGVASGPHSWLPDLEAWVLEGDVESFIVTSTGAQAVPGRLGVVAAELAARDVAEIVLFEDAGTEDPDGMVAHLKARGLEATSRERKGGGWSGIVTVRAPDLAPLARALMERKYVISSLRIEQPRP